MAPLLIEGFLWQYALIAHAVDASLPRFGEQHLRRPHLIQFPTKQSQKSHEHQEPEAPSGNYFLHTTPPTSCC